MSSSGSCFFYDISEVIMPLAGGGLLLMLTIETNFQLIRAYVYEYAESSQNL
jgi:hypothetical protein